MAGYSSLVFVLMVECPKAGEFQSTLKAGGVTDKTSGYFKATVGPGGKYPRLTWHFIHLQALTLSLLTAQFLPVCTQGEGSCVSLGTEGRCSYWPLKQADFLIQCSLENEFVNMRWLGFERNQ